MTDLPPVTDAPDLVAAAEALLDALGGAQAENTQRLAEDIESLETLLAEVQAYEELLLSEHTDPRRRRELIETLFSARAAHTAAGDGQPLRTLRGIGSRLRTILQARQGKVEVQLTTAVELSDEQRADALAKLQEALGRVVVLNTAVQPDLLGGARVQIGDSVFDASLSVRLKHVRERLSAAASETTHTPDVTPS